MAPARLPSPAPACRTAKPSVSALACAGGVSTAGIGSYPITPSAATSGTFTPGNYSIIYSTAGTLTVGAATLTITATDDTKTYGQTKT